jgi:hypothetical protein
LCLDRGRVRELDGHDLISAVLAVIWLKEATWGEFCILGDSRKLQPNAKRAVVFNCHPVSQYDSKKLHSGFAPLTFTSTRWFYY